MMKEFEGTGAELVQQLNSICWQLKKIGESMDVLVRMKVDEMKAQKDAQKAERLADKGTPVRDGKTPEIKRNRARFTKEETDLVLLLRGQGNPFKKIAELMPTLGPFPTRDEKCYANHHYSMTKRNG